MAIDREPITLLDQYGKPVDPADLQPRPEYRVAFFMWETIGMAIPNSWPDPPDAGGRNNEWGSDWPHQNITPEAPALVPAPQEISNEATDLSSMVDAPAASPDE
jgi:hypothetical protein